MKRWDVLTKIIQEKDYKSGIEVGVFKGENLLHLLAHNPDLRMLGIDKELTPEALSIQLALGQRCEIWKGLSVDYSQNISDGAFDFVFIDADHSYGSVCADLCAWAPKVRKGGMLSGHDYGHPRFPGVKKAVDEFFLPWPEAVKTHDDYVWTALI